MHSEPRLNVSTTLKILNIQNNCWYCREMFGVLNYIVCAFCVYVLMQDVHATSPSQFMDDIIGYRSACRSIGWEPKQGM